MKFFFAPDGTTAASTDPAPTPAPLPAKPRLPRAAFNRSVVALLAEADDLVVTARDARFAPMLAEYEITPAMVTALEANIALARGFFGIASSSAQSSQAGTAAKDALEDALEAAIRPVQTGARLSYPSSAADQRRYYIGQDLDQDETQLENMATTILKNLETDTLRGVTPAKIATLQSAYDAWRAAVLAHPSNQVTSQTDRAKGKETLQKIKPTVRDIKIAGDGAYPYDEEVTRPLRKLFHIPEIARDQKIRRDNHFRRPARHALLERFLKRRLRIIEKSRLNNRRIAARFHAPGEIEQSLARAAQNRAMRKKQNRVHRKTQRDKRTARPFRMLISEIESAAPRPRSFDASRPAPGKTRLNNAMRPRSRLLFHQIVQTAKLLSRRVERG